jgi:hypothetical protein
LLKTSTIGARARGALWPNQPGARLGGWFRDLKSQISKFSFAANTGTCAIRSQPCARLRRRASLSDEHTFDIAARGNHTFHW